MSDNNNAVCYHSDWTGIVVFSYCVTTCAHDYDVHIFEGCSISEYHTIWKNLCDVWFEVDVPT